MTRKLAKPILLGLLGLACDVGSIVWVSIWSYQAPQRGPLTLIVERHIPVYPRYLASVGLLLIVAALIWGVAASVGNKIFDRRLQ
jgi:hypothetical protein